MAQCCNKPINTMHIVDGTAYGSLGFAGTTALMQKHYGPNAFNASITFPGASCATQ